MYLSRIYHTYNTIVFNNDLFFFFCSNYNKQNNLVSQKTLLLFFNQNFANEYRHFIIVYNNIMQYLYGDTSVTLSRFRKHILIIVKLLYLYLHVQDF